MNSRTPDSVVKALKKIFTIIPLSRIIRSDKEYLRSKGIIYYVTQNETKASCQSIKLLFTNLMGT